MIAKIGIVTVSDSASRGECEDVCGAAISNELHMILRTSWIPEKRLVPNEQAQIEACFIELADLHGCCLILSSCGVSPARRDVTPEATVAVCEKLLPGFAETMRATLHQIAPATAMLSRQAAGTRGHSLIINLPSTPADTAHCLRAIFPAVPYCIDLLEGPYLETNPEIVELFRPAL
jgi:molybdopterin adenylyltransferase